jgi:hypothetical protein
MTSDQKCYKRAQEHFKKKEMLNFEKYLFDQLVWILKKGQEFEQMSSHDLRNLEAIVQSVTPFLIAKQTD